MDKPTKVKAQHDLVSHLKSMQPRGQLYSPVCFLYEVVDFFVFVFLQN